jgi:ferredoxin
MQTAVKGVFAAGDAVTGPNAAIQAVAGGRDAAFAIIQYLEGKEIDLGPVKPFSAVKGGLTKDDLPVSQERRIPMPALHDNAKRIGMSGSSGVVTASVSGVSTCSGNNGSKPGGNNSSSTGIGGEGKSFTEVFAANFVEVETGYTEEDALKEAHRCLECGCIKQNDCDLRDLAIEHEIEPSTDYDAMRHHKIDKSHPIVLRNPNKCIKCTKCVAICDEVVGVKALQYVPGESVAGAPGATSKNAADATGGFAGGYNPRGEVIPTGGVPLLETRCEACGQCISTCPTAALVENRPKFAREFLWPPKITATTCTYCGVGCQLDLNTDKAGKVFRVSTNFDRGSNEGRLCAKGRFGYHFVSHPDRLKTPLIRKNGVLEPASWDEAIEYTAKRLTEIKRSHGADSIGVRASGRCSNEDNYVLQKFTRAVIGTNNVDNCARL